MQKFKLFLMGSGFFWIFLWSVFGSLLGAKLNLMVVTGANQAWFSSLEKTLLTATHAHMNNMAMVLIIMALTADYLRAHISARVLKIVCGANIVAIPLFGTSMLLEAFYPPRSGHFSFFSLFAGVGGILYMISLAVWASFLLFAYTKK